jgi:hypothetical protein
MNLNDKNIEQVFRDAAQNSDAPRYDHSYWSEVNSILDSDDKRKRGLIYWSVAGSLVVAFLISSLFIVNNNESNLSLADNSNISSEPIDESQKALERKTFSENSTSTEVKNKNITNIQSNSNQTNSKDSKSKSNIGENKYVSSIKKSSKLKNAVNFKENIPLTADIQNSDKVKSDSFEKQNEQSKVKSLNYPDSPENREVEMLLPKIVELEQIQVNNKLLPIRATKGKSLNLYAKISAGLMENYETSRPFQSSVFDLSLNIEYKKEHVLFRTGLGLQTTSNADLVVSERAKVYGFGITTHQNNLSYQSLYDIYIPAEIGYNLNNTSFGFGGQLNYMFGTSMNYEKLKNNIVISKAKIKGFNEGLNTFTAQGYIWMEQKLTSRFVAGIKVGTNLNSRIKEGRYFNESSTTNPLYGQITLRYNFNK